MKHLLISPEGDSLPATPAALRRRLGLDGDDDAIGRIVRDLGFMELRYCDNRLLIVGRPRVISPLAVAGLGQKVARWRVSRVGLSILDDGWSASVHASVADAIARLRGLCRERSIDPGWSFFDARPLRLDEPRRRGLRADAPARRRMADARGRDGLRHAPAAPVARRRGQFLRRAPFARQRERHHRAFASPGAAVDELVDAPRRDRSEEPAGQALHRLGHPRVSRCAGDRPPPARTDPRRAALSRAGHAALRLRSADPSVAHAAERADRHRVSIVRQVAAFSLPGKGLQDETSRAPGRSTATT